ncbi:MAG: hypothetical protein NWF06_07880 [Candidatus Bathyarchaeota archaeon]|nr:hypothetical protein [Candidatus Bathyarchaeum sp.]
MLKYNIHNLVKIESNIDFGLPKVFKVDNIENVDLTVNAGRFNPNFFGASDNVYCFESGSSLLRFTSQISDIFGKTKIAYSGPRGFVRKKTINNMINTVVSWKLLMKNHALVYGDCLEKDGKGVLIIGPSGVGKTLTSLHLLTQHDFNYLGNDEIILSNANVAYSYPIAFKMRPKHLETFNISLSTKEQFIFYLRNNLRRFPFFCFISESFVDTDRLPCDVNIKNCAKIERIYWLEQNGDAIEETKSEYVLNQYLSLNLFYWWWLWSKNIQLCGYLTHTNNKVYLGDLISSMEQTIKSTFDKSKCFIVKDNHGKWYRKIMQDFE